MIYRVLYLVSKIRNEYRRFKSQNWGSWWNFRHGFLPKTIAVCGINRDNYRDFISDVDYVKGHPYNGMYSSIIDNKLYLPLLLHNYREYVPQYYFFKDSCGFLPLDSTEGVRVGVDAVLDKLREVGSLVCKRVADSLGNGFTLIEYIEEAGTERMYVNKKTSTVNEVVDVLASLNNCIITEVVRNHPYAAAVAPNSLNTIRLLLVWDDDKQEFFIPRAFHRFGCAGSVVDNLAAGNGILAYINPETGEMLKEGVISNNGVETYTCEELVHPDSQIKLTGMVVPGFENISQTCLRIFGNHSYLRYLGIDVAVTDSGFKIIEINSLTTLPTIQQRVGFLSDSRIRKVLKH